MFGTKPSSSRGHLLALVVTAVCVVIALLLLLNRQYVIDQISVWQYRPSGEIVAFADRSSMTDSGKFYFYASQPSLEASEGFNEKCDRKEESTAILGCYNGRYIYIYNVTDTKLDGIREVTAAHEMLHAAYDRLSGDERKRVDVLLEAEYAKLKSNKALAERMAFYDRTEPGERNNELHSVIGTEVAAISDELEAHYKRYFANRQSVLTLHAKYESVFNDLKARGQALADELTSLADSIEQESVSYNKDVTQLNHDIAAFNTKANSGGFVSQADYQVARASLVDRANRLEVQRNDINNKVARHEVLRQELLSISSESQALNRSLDSSLAPSPSL